MAEASKTSSAPAKKDSTTPSGDGKITNTADGHGTRQSEPTPEMLPPDAKVAPVAEQQAPNQMAKAVGAVETEDSGEGNKQLLPDMGDASKQLPDDSEQHDDAKRAETTARLRSEGKII
jgi:hypothetical protein